MKKGFVWILGLMLFAGMGLTILTPRDVEAQTLAWKMQTTWPAGIALHRSAVGLAKRIEEMSGGRIKIDI
ncbi:MAG: C4-dicarboxylate ABC transporter, partial [Deltaproteobacteria bacterium]|nr:C4-dicarboxylate ABC transporter [Deltaproteobacteria bacterium]